MAYLMVGLAAFCARADLPVVTWASYPVGAGEHVLVHGGAWGRNPRFVSEGYSVPATVLSDSGLVFPFPADSERIVEGRVVGDG